MPATLHQLRSEQPHKRMLDTVIALMGAKDHGKWSMAREDVFPSGTIAPQLPLRSHALQFRHPFSTEELNLNHQATLTTAPAA